MPEGEKEKPKKDYDEFDLLYNPMKGKRHSAFKYNYRILCQKIAGKDVFQYEHFYNNVPIIKLYEYAAIEMAIYNVSK